MLKFGKGELYGRTASNECSKIYGAFPHIDSGQPNFTECSIYLTKFYDQNVLGGGEGTEESKGKKMQPKGSVGNECEGISSMLVERDRNARSLGQELEVILALVAENIDKAERLEALTYSAIYLKWISSGQIPWSEDGDDDQPNNYDEISRRIFCHLEIICSRKDISIQDILVIRKMHRCLSSFKAESTTFVPITKIEDVADREFKDFFNAGSLEEQLESIRVSLDQSSAALPRFLESKQQLANIKVILDIGQDKWMSGLMNVLQALDNLREEIVKGLLESELQNDACTAAIMMHQKWRLCEIELEDYSSLLLSRFLYSLEAVGGSRWLAKHVEQKNVESWNAPLGALIKSIHQLGLSGWKPQECRAIGNELIAWQETSLLEPQGDEDGTRIWGLRLKATLERAERLTEEYSEALFNIFPEEKVQTLGEAFGILENSVKTYAEAEIRADVIFQVSYLCTLLLKAVREIVNARGWDILVPGNASGKLIEVENIGSIPSSETELIVVVKKAEGDEEVKAAGPDIAGVILLQRLPRLSHLVLRARKEKIVVTTCEDDEVIKNIQNLSGEDVMLDASSDGVSLSPLEFPAANSTESEPPVKPFEIYKGLLHSIGGAMRVEDVEALARCARVKAENICGTKAAAFCRLASLAAESIQVKNDVGVPASFKVPKGAVIPFCSIQRALDIDKAKSSSYLSLVESIEKAKPPDDTAALHGKLRDLISSLSPSEEVIRELSYIFPDNARLRLLPSASVEDLREIRVSGKGEPILTSSLSNRDLLKGAISCVWASLYSPETFLSRKAARVESVRDTDMAVLVQEMLSPELSFMLHIVSPMADDKVLIELEEDGNEVEIDIENEDVNEVKTNDENKDVIEVEIVPGLAVALAWGTGATPWRLSYDKKNDTVETLAFANFSEESVVQSGGATDGEVVKLTVDYSKKPLTMDPDFRKRLCRQLGAVGSFLAKKLKGRHNVEGCLVGEDIYIVQTRIVDQNMSGNLGGKMGL
ncbi:hypothetical protein C2S51_038192 [Perilla frutescens var. frutescens]|nr:hypothetical protein C2S51_038192 [Perilla frutescens var. frutescens]